MNNWKFCRLGDVITLKRGYDLPLSNRQHGPFPVITSSGFTGTHNIAKIQGPGVVTGRYGTLGEVYYIDSDFWPHNTVLYVQDFKGNHPKFISYFLRGLNFNNQNAAAAVPGVNRNYLHLLPVNIPPVNVQIRISDILTNYDDLIENNQHRIKILEEMARSLYREWFVHFRYPGHEKDRRVKSALGEIPEGWEVVPFEKLLVSMTGGDWGSELPNEDDTAEVRIVRGTDFEEVAYGGELRVPIRYIKPSSLNSRGLRVGDIIIENSVNAKSRCIGTPLLVDVYLLDRLGRQAVAASFCKVFRFQNPILAPIACVHLRHLREEKRMEYYQNVAANGIGNFQAQKFAKEEYLLLPIDQKVRVELIGRIATIMDSVSLLASQIQNLRRTRDLLLPRLMAGQVY